jgi:hypothetical protein
MSKLSPGRYLLLLPLVLLVSCEESPDADILNRGWSPLTCLNQAGAACDSEWYITFKGEKTSNKLQIVINNEVVIDECNRESYWNVSRLTNAVEFRISNYASLSGRETFDVRIFDLKDCYSLKTELAFWANQTYQSSSVNGKKRISFEREL